MTLGIFFTLFVLQICLTDAGDITSNQSYASEEARLYAELFHNIDRPYLRSVRPVRKPKDVIEVNFGMSLQQIIKLDEDILYTNVWLLYEWMDIQLGWNESNYGGVRSIRVEIETIWLPDIMPYNAVHMEQIHEKATAVVYSDGKVSLVPTMILETTCSMDFSKYPFDTQWCYIKFGSWTYNGAKLNLTSRSDLVDLSTYAPNSHYELLSPSRAKRSVIHYDCCPETYIDITFSLQLKRRNSYAAHLLVAPSVIMAIVLPVIFILPPESAEKMSFGIGLLITDSVLLLAVMDGIPHAAKPTMPLLAVYPLTNMILVCISLAISAFVMNIWKKGQRSMVLPNWVNMFIVNPLSKVLCVTNSSSGGGVKRLDEVAITDDVDTTTPSHASTLPGSDWRQLAIVLDRLCFVVFAGVVLIMIIVFGSH